ncbi:hypothetical protein [Polaromonas sp.]|jgi:hypothetical protein|nr:hypothetical protein [Polaromonas sp.]HQS30357.1 hypothetical protein [Polaromonas sp.]HQS89720.1 hypothetical protein [Polaromonas sp.]
MTDNTPAYGLWALVIFNSAIFLMFAFSSHPEWLRSLRSQQSDIHRIW